ncbi:MAG: Dabb family protein [Clostridiales bacterium]|nr:Dabb family protein [Clostridiales bacterium]
MIKHIVFTKFENPDEQASVAGEMLLALKDRIPEIHSIETGRDFKHSERSFDLALIVTFDTKEDLAAYDRHPEHEKARAYIKAHRTATATVDFEF